MEKECNCQNLVERIENLEFLTRYSKVEFDSSIPIERRVAFLKKAEQEATDFEFSFNGEHELVVIGTKVALKPVFYGDELKPIKGSIFQV